MSEDDKGFEVKDSRKAREALVENDEAARERPADGPRETHSDSQTEPPRNERPKEDVPGQGTEDGTGGGARELPPLDFLSFIGSLAATAFMHLGEKLSPDHPQMPVNLAAAKQMIDLIDLLKTKTRGNLAKQETDALESILYNLRMRFLHQSKAKQGGAAAGGPEGGPA